jgi:hypothetical protein
MSDVEFEQAAERLVEDLAPQDLSRKSRRSPPCNVLEDEFQQYYESERCSYAPEDHRRVFGLAHHVFQEFHERLDHPVLMAAIYGVLGYRRPGGRKSGLFFDFDPLLYHGRRSLEEHFLSMFSARLKSRLSYLGRSTNRIRHQADGPLWREGRGEGETRRPYHEFAFASRGVCRGLPDHDAEWSFRLRQLLPLAINTLNEDHRELIRWIYWNGESYSKVARRLMVSHHTVVLQHGKALGELRAFYRQVFWATGMAA